MIRYNGDDGSALLDWPSLVECMMRMWSCWALTSRRYVCSCCYPYAWIWSVRLLRGVRLNFLQAVIARFWCSMGSYVILPHVPFFFKQKTAYEMQRSLVGSEMCIRDSYNGDDGSALLDWPSLIECMERMLLYWRLTSRAYVCLYCYLCVCCEFEVCAWKC